VPKLPAVASGIPTIGDGARSLGAVAFGAGATQHFLKALTYDHRDMPRIEWRSFLDDTEVDLYALVVVEPVHTTREFWRSRGWAELADLDEEISLGQVERSVANAHPTRDLVGRACSWLRFLASSRQT
jgi:hypothetical protein